MYHVFITQALAWSVGDSSHLRYHPRKSRKSDEKPALI